MNNGIGRYFSRRERKNKGAHAEKTHHHHHNISKDLYRIFHPEDVKKKDKEEDKKVKAILPRLEALGITDLSDSQVEYALRSRATDGDVEQAVEVLQLFEDALHGTIRDYDEGTKLLGAENRELVTCYLDSLLFAMFARLDSFESMLLTEFNDEPRKKLVTMLRLWVNMLRTGKLIPTDLTKHLQEALSACGWEEAARLRQQDVSEAFQMITDKLGLPLLTLKMDVYHYGKEDSDDHKYVKERLLEVALPAPSTEGPDIKLEDCLESYFNNRIEVRRHLQRRNTLQSMRSAAEKSRIVQIETELGEPSPDFIEPPHSHFSSKTPAAPAITRTESLFSRRSIDGVDPLRKRVTRDDMAVQGKRPRTNTKREVLMPAWQFFSLIPWLTSDTPPSTVTTDIQVAQHFTNNKPVLGICLKRYSMTAQGASSRLDTYIDIPVEMQLPHFISDGAPDGGEAIFGDFKLSLQSVICHRGKSLDSGHYIALVRGNSPNASYQSTEPQPSNPNSETQSTTNSAPAATDAAPSEPPSLPPTEPASPIEESRKPTGEWLRFDDLAKERVTLVDIQKALREECPYLLFYQVLPNDENLFRGVPPPYESVVRTDEASQSSTSSSSELVNLEEARADLGSTPLLEKGDLSLASTITPSNFLDFSKARTPLMSNQPTQMYDPSITAAALKQIPTPALTPPAENANLRKSISVNVGSVVHRHDPSMMDDADSTPTASLPNYNARAHSLDLTSVSASLTRAAADAVLNNPQGRKNSTVASTNQDDPLVSGGRPSMSSARRSSITFTDSSANGSVRGVNESGIGTTNSSVPVTPAEEHTGRSSFFSMARKRRNSSVGAKPGVAQAERAAPPAGTSSIRASWNKNRSRPLSQSGENRLSLNLSSLGLAGVSVGKLRAAVSKDKLSSMVNVTPIPGPNQSDTDTSTIDGAAVELIVPVEEPKNKGSLGIRRGKSMRTKKRESGEKEKMRSSSTNRLSAMMGQNGASNGKGSDGDSDRECIVM